MSVPSQWVWGTLTPDQLRVAAQLAETFDATIRALNLPQNRYSHTVDRRYQNLVGAQGEVAFRVITGRPLPTVEAMAGTWKHADVASFAVKTVSQRSYRLLFDDGDLVADVATVVLMLNEAPRFAIMGKISKQRAIARRRWGPYLPRPAWVVEQEDLDGWELEPREALNPIDPEAPLNIRW